MYFLKKNLVNIIICTLVFGLIGTVVNFFIPPSNTTYEEYYTLESGLEPNTTANLNVQLNETVNKASENVKVAAVDGSTDSSILEITINTEPGISYESIHAQVMDTLTEQNVVTVDNTGLTIQDTPNNVLKVIIILMALLIGAVIGTLMALSNRNISTEEDIQHYLGERTLGSF